MRSCSPWRRSVRAAGPIRNPEVTASEALPIQGGTTDTTDTFVVAVVEAQAQPGEIAICTGSLLAPNLVATARHCVAPATPQPVACDVTAFGTTVAPESIDVTSDTSIVDPDAQWSSVQKIVVPSGVGQSTFCGNDLALLILSQPISAPQYVTPVISPPMTDGVYSTKFTAIGYGVTTPADTTSETAGTRRIVQDLDVVCLSNDSTLPSCLSDASADFLSPNEFVASGGTCDGDSGSGAFEQTNFNAGVPLSFGVLSRGSNDADGSTCINPIYTRFDAWGPLILQTAVQAAQLGGYATPAWAATFDAGAGQTGESGAPISSSCLSNAAACGADGECCSENCLSHDGVHFTCEACDDAANPCDTGYTCDQGTCVLSGDSGAGTAQVPKAGPSSKGCSASGTSVRANGSELVAAGLAGLLLGRRRRGASRQRA